MSLTTTQKINVGNISSVLVSNYLGSGRVIKDTPQIDHPYLTYAVRQALEWLNFYDSANADIDLIGNYLISICYNEQKAERILAAGGGGTVSPVSGNTALPKYFVVSDDSFMVDGQSSATITDFIGFNLIFTRGGIPQSTISTEDSYFTWNKINGLFSCTPALTTSELIGLIPV